MNLLAPEVTSPIETLKKSLASAFIGFTLSTTLYGITCLQLFLYYRNYVHDPLALKITAGLLWTLDTLATAMVAHTLYTYLVFMLGESDPIFIVPWSYAVQVEAIDLTTFITQSFFAWQIWRLSRNWLLTLLIIFLAFSAIGLDLIVVVHLFEAPYGSTLADPLVWASGSTVQGICALCDIIITCTFFFNLNSQRTGTQVTEKLIDTLILYSVGRGTITVVDQVLFFSLNVALPGEVYWLPFQQTVGKLYVNSVLSTLNSRNVLPFKEETYAGGSSPTTENLTNVFSTISPTSFCESETMYGSEQPLSPISRQHHDPEAQHIY